MSAPKDAQAEQLWNPVKELKEDCVKISCSCLVVLYAEWNPVKELKVIATSILVDSSRRWNPVKELKVSTFSMPEPASYEGWNPVKELKAE